MPLSRDPDAKARQLANLRPGAKTAPPGNSRALKHGTFASIPRDQLDAEVRELYGLLADAAPLRGPGGDLPQADEAAVEVAARALKRWRGVVSWCDRFGRFDERTGDPKPAARYELEAERALHRGLDVLGLNPASRARLGLDVARTAAALDPAMALSEPDPELRRELLQQAGLLPREGQ